MSQPSATRPEDPGILAPTFDRLWPVFGDTSQFEPLLTAIDEAVVRQACYSRLARFHRTLERHYSV